MAKDKGKLYIVATPIGNLGDISFRAIDILKQVSLIACEDTRNTIKILNHYNIKNNLISYHEHNKFDKLDELINKLNNGYDIAIVTDAGTPIISDPGDVLVKEAIKENIDVISIPGPTALINALVVSGLYARSFTFIGFLPDNKKEKIDRLKKYVESKDTLIFYSSKSQIKKDIDIVSDIYDQNRKISIAREMTKIHEEIIRGSIKNIKENIKDRDLLGEFVVCIEGMSDEDIINLENKMWEDLTIEEHVAKYINDGYDEKDAIKKVSKDRNIDKNDVYKKIKVKGE